MKYSLLKWPVIAHVLTERCNKPAYTGIDWWFKSLSLMCSLLCVQAFPEMLSVKRKRLRFKKELSLISNHVLSPGSTSDLPVVKCYIQVLQMLLVQLPHPGKQLSLQIFHPNNSDWLKLQEFTKYFPLIVIWYSQWGLEKQYKLLICSNEKFFLFLIKQIIFVKLCAELK